MGHPSSSSTGTPSTASPASPPLSPDPVTLRTSWVLPQASPREDGSRQVAQQEPRVRPGVPSLCAADFLLPESLGAENGAAGSGATWVPAHHQNKLRVALFGTKSGGSSSERPPLSLADPRERPSRGPSSDAGTPGGTPADVTHDVITQEDYVSDFFRMYCFKIRPCSRAYSHDWTECPFLHPGENARRRDPRKFQYSCIPCPEFRKGECVREDECQYAHGVFESWLHPQQYRTRLCKEAGACERRVCFFAHSPEELRVPDSLAGVGLGRGGGGMGAVLASPRGTPRLPPLPVGDMHAVAQSPDIPPPSPSTSIILGEHVSCFATKGRKGQQQRWKEAAGKGDHGGRDASGSNGVPGPEVGAAESASSGLGSPVNGGPGGRGGRRKVRGSLFARENSIPEGVEGDTSHEASSRACARNLPGKFAGQAGSGPEDREDFRDAGRRGTASPDVTSPQQKQQQQQQQTLTAEAHTALLAEVYAKLSLSSQLEGPVSPAQLATLAQAGVSGLSVAGQNGSGQASHQQQNQLLQQQLLAQQLLTQQLLTQQILLLNQARLAAGNTCPTPQVDLIGSLLGPGAWAPSGASQSSGTPADGLASLLGWVPANQGDIGATVPLGALASALPALGPPQDLSHAQGAAAPSDCLRTDQPPGPLDRGVLSLPGVDSFGLIPGGEFELPMTLPAPLPAPSSSVALNLASPRMGSLGQHGGHQTGSRGLPRTRGLGHKGAPPELPPQQHSQCFSHSNGQPGTRSVKGALSPPVSSPLLLKSASVDSPVIAQHDWGQRQGLGKGQREGRGGWPGNVGTGVVGPGNVQGHPLAPKQAYQSNAWGLPPQQTTQQQQSQTATEASWGGSEKLPQPAFLSCWGPPVGAPDWSVHSPTVAPGSTVGAAVTNAASGASHGAWVSAYGAPGASQAAQGLAAAGGPKGVAENELDLLWMKDMGDVTRAGAEEL